jgi:hypothetical protein
VLARWDANPGPAGAGPYRKSKAHWANNVRQFSSALQPEDSFLGKGSLEWPVLLPSDQTLTHRVLSRNTICFRNPRRLEAGGEKRLAARHRLRRQILARYGSSSIGFSRPGWCCPDYQVLQRGGHDPASGDRVQLANAERQTTAGKDRYALLHYSREHAHGARRMSQNKSSHCRRKGHLEPVAVFAASLRTGI